MSNLEHLIENGLCHLDEGKSYREWREIMQQDCNWEGNENITIDNLWEICQYVIFTWDSNRTYECENCACAIEDRIKPMRGLRAKAPMIDDYCEVPPDLVIKLTS